MKIIEVRDGFVKLESSKRIDSSSFLEIKGIEKRYIAQVIRSKNNGTGYSVYAKILFIYDGTFRKYDKTMPNSDAEVTEFPFSVVNNSFNYSHPIVAGKFISDNANILMDSDNFNNYTLASIDNPEMNSVIIQNFAGQFRQSGKTIVIDMLGVLNCDKYVAGRDFKLPLNTESLKFMYEDCLNDATSESKDLIKEIFADLAEYSKSVKFLPFSTLKMIVDDMVEKSHIFKLLILKNKLMKFDSAGYFASNSADAENLSKILKSDYAVIDLSKIDNLFQNRYLEFILSEIKVSNVKTFVCVEVSNAINKKNIKNLLCTDSIKTTLFTHSRFKYLSDIKSLFKNYILENTYANRSIFSLYSFFIESMGPNNYMIVGDGTNYVPLISNAEKYDVKIEKLPQDSVSEEVINTSYDSKVTDESSEYQLPDETEDEPVPSIFEDDQDEYENMQTPEDSEDLDFQNLADEDIPVDTDEEDTPVIEVEHDEDAVSIYTNNADDEEILEEIEPEAEVIEAETEIVEPESEVLETESDIIEQPEIEDITEYTGNEDIQKEEVEDIVYEDLQSEEEQESLVETIDVPDDLAEDMDAAEAEIMEEDASDLSQELSEEGSMESAQVLEVLPLENQETEIGEFEEIDTEAVADEDILVDLTDEEELVDAETETQISDSELTAEELDKGIVEDVDKVFTTMKDDDISDSDLDFIDTLNEFDNPEEENSYFAPEDSETLQELDGEEEEGFLEPLEEVSDLSEAEPEKEILEKRESSTPMVPIYEAEIPEEDRVVSDDVEQGDTVVHAKYGTGVVEKMIKYGNKNLYSINFDNVGRRLLDPTLTEIKKA